MAHKEQKDFIDRVKSIHPVYFSNTNVLEIGSWNVNGTVRDFFSSTQKYIGLDIAPGSCVDVVCSGDEYDTTDRFDVSLSCECFEHNPKWVETFANAIRLTKPNGLILFTCATTGRKEHGTSKSEPENSLTSMVSDYYRNLTQLDFESHFNFSEIFSEYVFEVNDDTHDLYFYGIKKPATVSTGIVRESIDDNISIGAIYSTFDGLNLLETSLNSIRKSVNYVVVVHQTVDFYGNQCVDNYESIFNRLIERKLIDDVVYVNDLGSDKESGMIEKRNIGLRMCDNNLCTYVMPMDADECYDANSIVATASDMKKNNINVAYSPIITYYNDVHHYFYDFYYVPSMYKMRSGLQFGHYASSVICDPLRKMEESTFKVYTGFHMHHLSYVHNNLRKKFESSISRSSEMMITSMNRVSEYFDTWTDTKPALVFGENGKLITKELTYCAEFMNIFGNILDDLTLITCSYETPEITETMLKSFRYANKELSNMKIIVMENSIKSDTRDMLDLNNIPYVKNPNGKHSQSLDTALKMCLTKYALVVDTDIIFNKPISSLLNHCKVNAISLGGYKTFYRAGYNLKPRINPWFMIINVDDIKSRHISFHDQSRIDKTKSNVFFASIPVSDDKTTLMYDVGSTFYEDVKSAKLSIECIPTVTTWFKHYEGASWRHNSNDSYLISKHADQMLKYKTEIEKVKHVDIKNFYYRGF